MAYAAGGHRSAGAQPGPRGRSPPRTKSAPPAEDLDAARLVSEAVGIFGGSGSTAFLDDAEEVAVDTPYGPPSAPSAIGRDRGARRWPSCPRHGDDHELPAAPDQLPGEPLGDEGGGGAQRIIGPSACGSLKPELEPGTFVVCDQFVDRTRGREDTFYDGPRPTHVSAADPYCPDLRRRSWSAARELDIPVVDGGTVVVIQGPRFSTRAESRWFAQAGWDVVNMTQYPEAWLARELELCYANVSPRDRLRRGSGGHAGRAPGLRGGRLPRFRREPR